ncbi:MAG TPA: hypothetical protein PLL06_21500 [Acidobacteriota bacterium]|nr:hypothetical protein [Acidobacteriota bacterium]
MNNPQEPKPTWLSHILARFRDPRSSPTFSIICTPHQLSKTRSVKGNIEQETVIAWQDIAYLLAYKRDLWAVDLICIEVGTCRGFAFEIDEEMDGWEVVVNRLPEYLPGCPAYADWWQVVAHPPFARNETQLYPVDNKDE